MASVPNMRVASGLLPEAQPGAGPVEAGDFLSRLLATADPAAPVSALAPVDLDLPPQDAAPAGTDVTVPGAVPEKAEDPAALADILPLVQAQGDYPVVVVRAAAATESSAPEAAPAAAAPRAVPASAGPPPRPRAEAPRPDALRRLGQVHPAAEPTAPSAPAEPHRVDLWAPATPDVVQSVPQATRPDALPGAPFAGDTRANPGEAAAHAVPIQAAEAMQPVDSDAAKPVAAAAARAIPTPLPTSVSTPAPSAAEPAEPGSASAPPKLPVMAPPMVAPTPARPAPPVAAEPAAAPEAAAETLPALPVASLMQTRSIVRARTERPAASRRTDPVALAPAAARPSPEPVRLAAATSPRREEAPALRPAEPAASAAPPPTAAPASPAQPAPTPSQSPVSAGPVETQVDRALDVARDGAWLDRLAREIAMAGDRDGTLRFRLNPQSLGQLRVEITPAEQGAAVRFAVETEAARTLLVDAQPRLAAEARAQGVRIAETHVDLGQGGQHASGDPRRQDETRQPMIRTAGGASAERSADERQRSSRADRYA